MDPSTLANTQLKKFLQLHLKLSKDFLPAGILPFHSIFRTVECAFLVHRRDSAPKKHEYARLVKLTQRGVSESVRIVYSTFLHSQRQ